MDIQAVIERLFSKTSELAAKLEKLKVRNSELKEENRVLENQLNDYTEIIGDLEMQIIELKQQLEGKKKK
jgi:chromosome segregation ATPase